MDKKKPIIGGLLNILLPGLADVYVGHWGQAFVTLIGAAIFAGFLYYVLGRLTEPPWPDFVCPGVMILTFYTIMFIGGAAEVRKYNDALEWGKCPYCKKTFKIGEPVCEHCGKDLVQLPKGMKIKPARPPRGKGNMAARVIVVILLIGFLTVLIAGLILNASGKIDLSF